MNFLKNIAIGFGVLFGILLTLWFLLIAGVSAGVIYKTDPRLFYFIPAIFLAIVTYKTRRRKGKWFYGCGIGAIVFTLAALGY